MIELFKLISLPHTQKIRKIIKILEVLEAESFIQSTAPKAVHFPLSCDAFYLQGLLRHITEQYPADSAIIAAAESCNTALREESTAGCRTALNTIRHALYRHSGVQPSEWDLIAPGIHYGTHPSDTQIPQHPSAQEDADSSQQRAKKDSTELLLHETHPAYAPQPAISRPFHPGVYVYAEDIRAPFNLGSIFRTAEAFGVEKLFISADCVSPNQPRAQRSAMGCTTFLPWERSALEQLPSGMPVFALETGGTPITAFQFPPQGVILLGSEELGLSAEALKRADAGVVSIPMKGIKASLNVAVAFGILMQYWTASLQ